MHQAGDGQAILGLQVVHAVPADDGAIGLARHLRATREDFAEQLEGLRPRPADHVQGIEGPSAHRVHVGEGIRRRDPAVIARIVDHGRKEVERRYEARAGIQLPHRRVVARLGSHQQRLRAASGGQFAQDLRELRGAELAGSTGSVAQEREPDRLRVTGRDLGCRGLCGLVVHDAPLVLTRARQNRRRYPRSSNDWSFRAISRSLPAARSRTACTTP